jgi:hypothetical protein
MSEASPEILDGPSGGGQYNAFEGMDTPRIRHITGYVLNRTFTTYP